MEKFNGTGVNPKDPLNRAPGLELLQKLSHVCNDASYDVVLDAAINLVVRTLRQAYPTLPAAQARLFDRVKIMDDILKTCYDPVSGKRLSIFPFNQTIRPSVFIPPDQAVAPTTRNK